MARVLYLTYCSRRKRRTPERLPALQRYRSARIGAVARAAERDGCGFRIFSGKYGLLRATQPIPYYDHLLQPDEVPAMTRRLAAGLRGYTAIVFWYAPGDYLTPYRAALRTAARQAGVPLRCRARRTWR